MANYYLASVSSLGLVIQAAEIAVFVWLQARSGFDDEQSKLKRLFSTFNVLWLVMWLFTVVFSACTLLISLRPESPSQVETLFGVAVCSLDAAVIFYSTTILLRAQTDVLMVPTTPRVLFAAVCASGLCGIGLKSADLLSGKPYLRLATMISMMAMGAVTVVFDAYFVRFFWKEYRRWRTTEVVGGGSTSANNSGNTSGIISGNTSGIISGNIEKRTQPKAVQSVAGIVTRYSLAACLCSGLIFLTAVATYIARGFGTRDLQELGVTLTFAPTVLLAMKWRLQNLRVAMRSSAPSSAFLK